MKNYLPKVERYILSIKNNVSSLRNKNPFGIIILSIALVFILLLYFTIPTFYDYENFDKEIQKKVSKDFKLDLKNISNITYLMIPTPHFLIEECDLYFANDSKERITRVKNLKINIYTKNLHKKEKIELKNIYLNKIDFDLNFIDLKNFYNHLNYSITKPIYFTNSNLFFRDNSNEIISISKLKNLNIF
jgi:AsmA family.